jgi:hypothetical protein
MKVYRVLEANFREFLTLTLKAMNVERQPPVALPPTKFSDDRGLAG